MFNKDKLLSSKSSDEFALHLPNPLIYVTKIIEDDDINTWTTLIHDLGKLLRQFNILISSNDVNLKKLLSIIFHFKPSKILSSIENGSKEYYSVYGYHNFVVEFMLMQHNTCTVIEKIPIETKNTLNPIGTNMLLELEQLYEKKESDQNESRSERRTLKKSKKFEYYNTTQDIYTEYIKWIMEISFILQFDNHEECYDMKLSKYTFWHHIENKNIINKLLPLSKDIWTPIRTCYEKIEGKKCNICCKMLTKEHVLFYNQFKKEYFDLLE